MKLKDLYDLSLKCKNYNDFLTQIKRLHRYADEITLNQIERQINVALGNKIPDSAFEDRFNVERKQIGWT